MKKTTLLLIFFVIIIVTVGTRLDAYICGNESDGNWGNGTGTTDPGTGTSGGNSKIQTIDLDKIIRYGSACILDAETKLNEYIRSIELYEWDQPNILSVSIQDLREARYSFSQLYNMTKSMPQNPVFQEGLKNYDYSAFLARGGDPNIAKEITSYLREGNVSGIYLSYIAKLDTIIAMAEQLFNQSGNRSVMVSTLLEFNKFKEYGVRSSLIFREIKNAN